MEQQVCLLISRHLLVDLISQMLSMKIKTNNRDILGNDNYGMNLAFIRNTFRTGVYNVKDYKQYYRNSETMLVRMEL